MINKHTGRRCGFHTGKETLSKYRFHDPAHKKSNKKYRCRICGKRMPGTFMVEETPDKHGRVFYCVNCCSKK